MAFEESNGSPFTMPVSPMYGGNGNGFGFGGDWAWIILLLLLGWGNNGWGGNGGYGNSGGLYPWMNQANLTSEGFQNQLMNDNITSIRDGIYGVSSQICNGFAQAEIAANGRQMADMNQRFALQSQLADCCCENRLGTADLKYTIASEECSTRANSTANTQAILDKLCQLELDGVKAQVEAKNDRIAELQTQLNMANLAASQANQTAAIEENIYSRLKNCPVPAMPVYGNTPIFTCGGNTCGCGCSGNSFFN